MTFRQTVRELWLSAVVYCIITFGAAYVGALFGVWLRTHIIIITGGHHV